MAGLGKSVVDQVSNELQAYVYLLIDPRDGLPFYVGKGQGMRHAAHLSQAIISLGTEDSTEQSRKTDRINCILADNFEPEVWILRYGMRMGEYTAVEAAVIDLLMSFPITASLANDRHKPLGQIDLLTNARRERSRGHGIIALQSLIEKFAAPYLTIQTPLLLITINGWFDLDQQVAGGRWRTGAGFRREWLASAERVQAFDEIGLSMSAWWSISPDVVAAAGIEYAVAVSDNITRGLYRIVPDSWEFAMGRGPKGKPVRNSAFQFEIVDSGPLFDEVVGPYGHVLPKRARGAQNAIRYWPRHPFG